LFQRKNDARDSRTERKKIDVKAPFGEAAKTFVTATFVSAQHAKAVFSD